MTCFISLRKPSS
jgi:hypothetical protein